MVQNIILNIAAINWILGMILYAFSNATIIISKTKYERKGWKKYRTGYTIKEIREVIAFVDQDLIKKKLKNKIIFRKIAIVLFLSTPVLVIIGNI